MFFSIHPSAHSIAKFGSTCVDTQTPDRIWGECKVRISKKIAEKVFADRTLRNLVVMRLNGLTHKKIVEIQLKNYLQGV